MKSALALSLLRYLTKYFVKYGNYCLFFPTEDIVVALYVIYRGVFVSKNVSGVLRRKSTHEGVLLQPFLRGRPLSGPVYLPAILSHYKIQINIV